MDFLAAAQSGARTRRSTATASCGLPEADKLTPANLQDLAAALAFALRYSGRKRVHNADEIMAEIVATPGDAVPSVMGRVALRALYAAGVIAIAIIAVNGSMAALFLRCSAHHASGRRASRGNRAGLAPR